MEPWKCPSLGCKYVGLPAIHMLSLPPEHALTAAQVADSMDPKKRYPLNWQGNEGP